MTALTIARPALIAPPDSLPVAYLSVSSLNLFSRCPLAWKRRYVDKLTEPPSGKMVRGSAAGAALAQHYGRQIESGEGLSTSDVLDEYAAEWDHRRDREEVIWGTDQPGILKDTGMAALALYHREIAPTITPVSVEREFALSWPDAPFQLTGFLDLETADDEVGDYKLGAQRLSADKAAADLQPTVYLAARRAEGNPASAFRFHAMAATKKPSAELVAAPRSERQLDLLTHRVFSLARAMQWRWLNDCWAGTPPDLAWLCRSCAAPDCAWRLG
jgi:RecB family exonuclease